jgi:hypothetical protein
LRKRNTEFAEFDALLSADNDEFKRENPNKSKKVEMLGHELLHASDWDGKLEIMERIMEVGGRKAVEVLDLQLDEPDWERDASFSKKLEIMKLIVKIGGPQARAKIRYQLEDVKWNKRLQIMRVIAEVKGPTAIKILTHQVDVASVKEKQIIRKLIAQCSTGS